MPVIANSSPLIYFAALSDFHFLRDIFASLVIPPAVYQEVFTQAAGFPVRHAIELALGDWLSIGTIQNRLLVDQACIASKLDIGEAEAIALAIESDAETLLLDDRRAVRYARSLGLSVTRTPIIYAEAKLRGWIPNVREKLDALRKKGFRLTEHDYRLVLAKLGEL
jgi:uncharacterized protein